MEVIATVLCIMLIVASVYIAVFSKVEEPKFTDEQMKRFADACCGDNKKGK